MYKLWSLQTYKLTNLQTCKLTNLQTNKLTNLQTFFSVQDKLTDWSGLGSRSRTELFSIESFSYFPIYVFLGPTRTRPLWLQVPKRRACLGVNWVHVGVPKARLHPWPCPETRSPRRPAPGLVPRGSAWESLHCTERKVCKFVSLKVCKFVSL